MDINSYPGCASIISYDLNYICVNKQMALAFNKSVKDFVGKPVGWLDNSLKEVLELFVNSDLQLGNWEVKCQTTTYLISAKKEPEGIVIFGFDISERKKLEESLKVSEARNGALMKALPLVLREAAGRRNIENFELLIEKLINEPLFTNSGIQELPQVQFEKLVRLEVEIREIVIRIKQIEKFLFISENSLLHRVKVLENSQKEDKSKWDNLESNLLIFTGIGKLLKIAPGGIKSSIIIMAILIIVSIASIDIIIRISGVEWFIKEVIEKIEGI